MGGAKRRITTAKDPGVATAEASKPGIALTCSGTPAGKCRSHDTRSLQDYLGHKNIQHTVRYTELAPTRFKDFWR